MVEEFHAYGETTGQLQTPKSGVNVAADADGGGGALARVSADHDHKIGADARPGSLRGRVLNLALMFFAPMFPLPVISVYAGPAHESAEGLAGFLIFASVMGAVQTAPAVVSMASIVFRWRFGLRGHLRTLAFALALYLPVVIAGTAAFAYGLPACLTVPFAPLLISGGWYSFVVPVIIAVWGATARRRLQRLHAGEEAPPHGAPGDRDPGPAVYDVESEPSARPPPPLPAVGRGRVAVSSPDELTAALATADGNRAVQRHLRDYLSVLGFVAYPLWGYTFLFALFSFSSFAQVLVSIAFSFFSFAISYGVLRGFRDFLYSCLPDGAGQGIAMFYVLHLFRSFRLWTSFRTSSAYVFAFGVLSDVATVFAPLLFAAPTIGLFRRAGRYVVPVLRPRRKSLSEAADEQLEESRLVRESSRALFFVQALVSICASGQFVVALSSLRFGLSAHAWPYHPAVLPHETYLAMMGAAAASVAILTLGLLAVRGMAVGSLAGASPVHDGFALGWDLVEQHGPRLAAMWTCSMAVVASPFARPFRIFSSVFPDSYIPPAPF